MYRKTIEQQFWSKVDRKSKEQCWEWTGAKNNAGYGNMKVNGKYVNSHRVSYELNNKKKIKEGLFICHHCDNPSCVNPNHLFSGTPLENDADKVKKRRHVFGMKHPRAKLVDQDIIKIKSSSGPHKYIADEYGVSRRLIGMIKQGSIWKHIK